MQEAAAPAAIVRETMEKNVSLSEAVARAAESLRRAGVSEPRRNAQMLMQHALGASMAQVLSRGKEELDAGLLAQFNGLVGRRTLREPLQYITGRAEFWSIEFYVDPRASIPRPETEHIIEEVLKDFPERGGRLRIVDVGTGSGILAVVLALEYPGAAIYAVDIEPGALEVARINAARQNVNGRIDFLRGDLLEPVMEALGPGSVDIIVSNPPYVSERAATMLAPEVTAAEPRRAIVGGPTGLEIYARLLPQAGRLLASDGRLYMECGAGQEEAVEAVVDRQPSVRHLRSAMDLQKIPRVVVCEKGRD